MKMMVFKSAVRESGVIINPMQINWVRRQEDGTFEIYTASQMVPTVQAPIMTMAQFADWWRESLEDIS